MSVISDLADEVRVLLIRQQVDIGTMQFGFMPGKQAGREVHLYYGERQRCTNQQRGIVGECSGKELIGQSFEFVRM